MVFVVVVIVVVVIVVMVIVVVVAGVYRLLTRPDASKPQQYVNQRHGRQRDE